MNFMYSLFIIQTDLGSCFNEFTEVALNKDKSQICVKLSSTYNEKCNILPRGIKVEATLDQLVEK